MCVLEVRGKMPDVGSKTARKRKQKVRKHLARFVVCYLACCHNNAGWRDKLALRADKYLMLSRRCIRGSQGSDVLHGL